MNAEIHHDSLDESAKADITVHHSNRHVASRLKQAVRGAGGNQVVATKAGIALSTLNAYLAGRDMKLSFTVELAKVCGVNIAWLATGEGPMSGPASSAPTLAEIPQNSAPKTAFGSIDPDRLALALDGATAAFSKQPSQPTMRELAQVVILLYDSGSDADITK